MLRTAFLFPTSHTSAVSPCEINIAERFYSFKGRKVNDMESKQHKLRCKTKIKTHKLKGSHNRENNLPCFLVLAQFFFVSDRYYKIDK